MSSLRFYIWCFEKMLCTFLKYMVPWRNWKVKLMNSPLHGDLEQLIMVTISFVIVLGKTEKVENKLSRKSIKCNCQWLIKLKILDQSKKDSIKRKKIFPHHTNTCTLSNDQVVMVRTAAGDYGKFTSLILKDLIKLINLNHFVHYCLICELL